MDHLRYSISSYLPGAQIPILTNPDTLGFPVLGDSFSLNPGLRTFIGPNSQSHRRIEDISIQLQLPENPTRLIGESLSRKLYHDGIRQVNKAQILKGYNDIIQDARKQLIADGISEDRIVNPNKPLIVREAEREDSTITLPIIDFDPFTTVRDIMNTRPRDDSSPAGT